MFQTDSIIDILQYSELADSLDKFAGFILFAILILGRPCPL